MQQNEEDFNAPQNSDKQTILMCATESANCKIMEQILNVKDSKGKRRIDINAQDKNGNTALSIAAKMGDDDKIILLLKNGADLTLAKKKISEKAWKNLEKNYQQMQTATEKFINAVIMRNIAQAKRLLHNSPVNVNMKVKSTLFPSMPCMESTPLFNAINLGNKELVELLLKEPSIDVNIRDEYGRTVLTYSVQRTKGLKRELLQRPDIMEFLDYSQKEIVEVLLKHPGIDVNVQDNKKVTPLMYATIYGRLKTVKLLLKHPKIDVNIQNRIGGTALICASEIGQKNIVELLINQPGIDINLQDNKGASPLHYAVNSV
ncbi:hypothetical protein PIROE2DRAFT_60293 [Piromyces sp. E2]|nr:hypothetical protein PIROE2DRAFT_60293 [Piromyces sp. E2]|eukprot:OUM64989.1 hypothetical protein PIROE2DRAFT_60293 [Piromyces sp. E2]